MVGPNLLVDLETARAAPVEEQLRVLAHFGLTDHGLAALMSRPERTVSFRSIKTWREGNVAGFVQRRP